MSFTAAIRKCFRDWITFSGRAPRSEYWWFFLFNLLLAMAFSALLLGSLFPYADTVNPALPSGLVVLLIAGGIVYVFLYIASISVTVRRLHDIGLSGWYLGGYVLLYGAAGLFADMPGTEILGAGLSLIMVILTVIGVILLCRRGVPGPNRWGMNPLYDGTKEVFE